MQFKTQLCDFNATINGHYECKSVKSQVHLNSIGKDRTSTIDGFGKRTPDWVTGLKETKVRLQILARLVGTKY